jgi:ribonuclease HI
MKVIVNIDGGSRGNPGPAAAGVVIRTADDGTVIHQAGVYLGVATNNVAEYGGLIEGLKRAAMFNATHVDVISDSQLMVRQMTGQYRVKNAGLKPLHAEAKQLARQFEKFTITDVRREHNKAADQMANLAMDAKANVED